MRVVSLDVAYKAIVTIVPHVMPQNLISRPLLYMRG